MKALLIAFLSGVIMLTFMTSVYAETITTVTTTTTTTKTIKKPCHHHKVKHKHHKKTYHRVRGYCVTECCLGRDACGCNQMMCYSRYYTCKTEYYYHSGRNSARVEVCQ